MEKGKIKKGFDIIGDIAIVKFEGRLKKEEKIRELNELLSKNKSVKRVFEKVGMISGEERLPKLRQLIGKGSLTLYKENKALFYVDVKKVYFSPRMSNERLRVTNLVGREESVLDMFCGVGPFAVPIAKKCKHVTAMDINETAIKLLEKNIKLNKTDNINYYRGDSKKIVKKLGGGFDRIIMNFPLYAYKFLDSALYAANKKCTIHLYSFIKTDAESGREEIIKRINKSLNQGFKVINIKPVNAGEVAPYLERVCFDIKIKKD